MLPQQRHNFESPNERNESSNNNGIKKMMSSDEGRRNGTNKEREKEMSKEQEVDHIDCRDCVSVSEMVYYLVHRKATR